MMFEGEGRGIGLGLGFLIEEESKYLPMLLQVGVGIALEGSRF